MRHLKKKQKQKNNLVLGTCSWLKNTHGLIFTIGTMVYILPLGEKSCIFFY